MNGYIWGDIGCPFFISETAKNLTCEGTEVGTRNVIKFENPKDKVNYIRKHCTHFPNECPIFKSAWENRK